MKFVFNNTPNTFYYSYMVSAYEFMDHADSERGNLLCISSLTLLAFIFNFVCFNQNETNGRICFI